MKRVRVICGVAAALLLTIGLLAVVQRLLAPKYQTRLVEGALTAEYYQETTTHDVLFLGDCEVFSNFSPVTLWRTYGVTSYIRGSAQQLVWQSYYLLEDTLQTETPKVVVYNVLALKYGTPQSEAYNRMTLDGMRPSKSKTAAIRASMTADEDALSYVFPLLRYHARWSELTQEDFTYWFRTGTVSHNGYLMETGVDPVTTLPLAPPLTDPALPETSMDYLSRMAALCEQNGIALVLIKSPSVYPHWYDEWDAELSSFAEAHGVAYYNMMDDPHTGVDLATDTFDQGQHLNVFGAEKLSAWFGGVLTERYALPDHRGDAAFESVWQEKIQAYEIEKAALLAAEES